MGGPSLRAHIILGRSPNFHEHPPANPPCCAPGLDRGLSSLNGKRSLNRNGLPGRNEAAAQGGTWPDGPGRPAVIAALASSTRLRPAPTRLFSMLANKRYSLPVAAAAGCALSRQSPVLARLASDAENDDTTVCRAWRPWNRPCACPQCCNYRERKAREPTPGKGWMRARTHQRS